MTGPDDERLSTVRVIADLADAFPNRPIQPTTVRVYARALADLDPAKLAAVARRIIATSTFFPTVSELRRRYFTTELAIPSSIEGWAEVESFIRRMPAGTERPEWSSPIVAATVASVGGLAAIRSNERPDWLRRDFQAAYEAAADAAADAANITSLEQGTPVAPEPDRLVVAARRAIAERSET